MWLGRIKDERLTEDVDYYLSVRAAMPAHALLEQLPALCKMGAPDDVEQVVNSALPGIALRPVSRLPPAGCDPGAYRKPVFRGGQYGPGVRANDRCARMPDLLTVVDPRS